MDLSTKVGRGDICYYRSTNVADKTEIVLSEPFVHKGENVVFTITETGRITARCADKDRYQKGYWTILEGTGGDGGL